MDFAPLVIIVSIGAILAFDVLALLFGADSREPMLDDHQR